jgi:hypothetical protein
MCIYSHVYIYYFIHDISLIFHIQEKMFLLCFSPFLRLCDQASFEYDSPPPPPPPPPPSSSKRCYLSMVVFSFLSFLAFRHSFSSSNGKQPWSLSLMTFPG